MISSDTAAYILGSTFGQINPKQHILFHLQGQSRTGKGRQGHLVRMELVVPTRQSPPCLSMEAV